MTAASFCQWVNTELLPSTTLPANYPRSISLRTATRWLHRLGFRPLGHKKGAYVDGHEREDVVAYRKDYLKVMHDLYSTHNPAPPCSDQQAPIPAPDAETRKKIVVIFHDESIFHINEGQTWAWGTEDRPYIQPKTKGAGVMVSDFIEQHGGYLRLSDQEHDLAKMNDSNFPKTSRVFMEYGGQREGYWTSEKFMNNVKDAAVIAKFKYPSDKYTIIWLFDQSSCHRAYAEDSLNVLRMNKRPGGGQACMRDTMWQGKVQKLVDENGVPKGMEKVLVERGFNPTHVKKFKVDEMRTILKNHEDFKSEKTIVEHYLLNLGHKVQFIPKFHCELNPIERVWGQAKTYTRMYTNFTLERLRQILHPALDSVSTDTIRKYFRKVQDYERAYREGKKAGLEVEQAIRKYKSHRRVFFDSACGEKV